MKLLTVSTTTAKEVLEKIVQSPHIPIATVWKLKKLVLKFNEHAIMYEQMRNELVRKYASKDAEGNFVEDANKKINVDPVNLEAYAAELSELLQIDAPVPAISVAELGTKVEGITVSDVMALGDLLVD